MMTHKILNRDPKDEILKAFRLFDDDETGKISFKNLKRVAKELGERMTDEELQEMTARVLILLYRWDLARLVTVANDFGEGHFAQCGKLWLATSSFR